MPKDSSAQPVYTSFDAARDAVKSAYYGSGVSAPLRPQEKARSSRPTPAVKPRKT